MVEKDEEKRIYDKVVKGDQSNIRTLANLIICTEDEPEFIDIWVDGESIYFSLKNTTLVWNLDELKNGEKLIG